MNEATFTDQDMLMDTLQSAKHMQNIYNTFSIEASNEKITKVIEDLYLNMKDQARDLFNLMYAKGWYKLEEESTTKINQAVAKLSKNKPSM